MLNVKVLGPGCKKCNQVEQQAVAALETLAEEDPSVEATIQHVTEYGEIMKYPIVFTPALVVNGQVVCAGRIPTVDEVAGWLREALDGTGVGE